MHGLVAGARILPEGSITISLGVGEVIAADSLDHWFNLADSALYRAKRNSRDRVEVARPVAVTREPIAKTMPEWR